MSMTIYGGTSKNGIFVSDMVDNNNDYIFRLSEGSKPFLRVSTWYEKEDMTGEYGIAFAGFNNDDPFEVLWVKKTSLTSKQCEDEDEAFAKELKQALLEYGSWYIDNVASNYEICYIDGETLSYKKYITCASSESEALNNLKKSYSWGDFDHQIISITHVLNDELFSQMVKN